MQLQMRIPSTEVKRRPADYPGLDFVLIPRPITISTFAPLSSLYHYSLWSIQSSNAAHDGTWT